MYLTLTRLSERFRECEWEVRLSCGGSGLVRGGDDEGGGRVRVAGHGLAAALPAPAPPPAPRSCWRPRARPRRLVAVRRPQLPQRELLLGPGRRGAGGDWDLGSVDNVDSV